MLVAVGGLCTNDRLNRQFDDPRALPGLVSRLSSACDTPAKCGRDFVAAFASSQQDSSAVVRWLREVAPNQ
jgi:hypothetical protein